MPYINEQQFAEESVSLNCFSSDSQLEIYYKFSKFDAMSKSKGEWSRFAKLYH